MPTCVITGASRGIGLELCRQLAVRGDRVIAVCRNSTPELRALGCEIVDGVEVTDAAAIASLAQQLRGEHIDVLINNAGILAHDSLDNLDLDGIRRQFEVNALGPLRITHALLSGLQSGAKVVIITSRMGSIGDNGSGGYYGYRMSKAAVNMAGASLARDLGERGITVLILHPGMVATDMTDRNGVPVADSAASLIARMDELGPEESGSFHHANGEPLPW
jgi:NAD(P)-dependent dehydrogenase (short-subunit alcohol dehydrogenase family)